MTPSEIYQMIPQRTTKELYDLRTHLPEIEYYDWRYENNEEVEIKIIKYFNFDGRRYWQLATVWFKSNPVMIIQSAGREGDDHTRRFITDKINFKEMAIYIRSLINIDEPEEIHPVDKDNPELTYFYNLSLEDKFERY